MGLAEQWTHAQEWADDLADAQEERNAAKADELRSDWDAMLTQRSIYAKMPSAAYPELICVLNDACSDNDQKIQNACMQALVHCAAKGQVEAIDALDMVKEFWVKKQMEMK